MKRLIPIFAAFLLLSACTAFPSKESPATSISPSSMVSTPETSQSISFDSENLGFSGCNIGQGGLMCGDGKGNVYYRSESDHWCLYKARLDGSEKRKLSDDIPCYINVLDGWIYFANYRDGFSTYRIRTDGTGRELLKKGYCNNIYVADTRIFYDVRDEKNSSEIHSMNNDGSDDILLVSDASLHYYFDGCLYCLNSLDNHHLWRYTLESGAYKQLNDVYSYYITVNKNGIYYLSADENKFIRMNLDGSDSEVLLAASDFQNVSGDYIYYKKSGGNSDFYRYSLKTGEESKVSSFLSGYFGPNGDIVEKNDETDGDDSLYNESGCFTFVIDGNVFTRGTLRDSLLKSGRTNCLIRLDGIGNMEIWD